MTFRQKFAHFFFVGSICAVCYSQQLRQGTPNHDASFKSAIEHRLHSKHPQVSKDPGKPVPGKYLLGRQSARSSQLRARIRAASLPHPPASNATLGVLPGIQFRPALPAGSMANAVVTGDFNKDGRMDFIVANGGTNDLWIYFGKGDGTFQLPQVIPLTKGQTPVYMATGDLRGIGTLDLIVAESDTSTIGVLLGNGDGTFGIEQEYLLPQPPGALAIDDFNHDGKLDIVSVMVTVNSSAQGVEYLATLFGDGTGSFGTPIITFNPPPGFYSTATSIVSGDVNNDGLPDVLITGPGGENSQVYLNAGNGTFTPGVIPIENGPFDILMGGVLADINGDGCLDAAVADLNGDVWTFLGDCTGNFPTFWYVPMGDDNSAVALIDMNGDGHLDIVTTALPILPGNGDVSGNTLSVAFGDGKGNFSPGRNYVGSGMSYSLAIADFNRDGHPDVVSVSPDTDTATVYINDGSGGFGFPQGEWIGSTGMNVLDAPNSPPSFADLNGDGKPDVLILDFGEPGEYVITTMLNDGTGRFAAPVQSNVGMDLTSGQPMGDYRLGDFRNTGHLDFVAIGFGAFVTTAPPYILFVPGNGDGTFGTPTLIATPGADGAMGVGDFNGDGKLDFVAVGAPPSGSGWAINVFLGNGDGTFRVGSTVTFTDSAQVIGRVFIGDFNRDGKLDILVYTTGNGYWTATSNVWEFLGNGDGTFKTGQKLFSAFQPMTMADVNGDSWLDIVRYDFFWPDGTTETYGLPKFTTYLGQASGKFSQSSSYTPYAGVPQEGDPFLELGDPTTSSKVADLNGDGKADEIAFQTVSPLNHDTYAQVLMGNGDGTFTPTYDVFDFQKSLFFPSYARTFDGTTFSDLLEVDSATSEMHLFKGGAAPAFQLSLEEAQVTGNSGCGWVFLDVPSTSDTVIVLSSSVTGVTLPASVTVPAASLSQQFCYTLSSNYNWRQVFDVQAQLGTTTAIAYASQSYVFGFSEAISPNADQVIYPTQSTAPITVSLTSSQGYTSTVHLSCQGLLTGATCVFGSDTLSVSPSAVASTTVVVNTSATTQGGGPVLIVASDASVTTRRSFNLTVQPLIVDVIGELPPATTSPGTTTGGIMIVGLPPYKPSCVGLPAGVTCAFSGSQWPWPSDTDLGMTVTVPSGIAAGAYPFTAKVVSGPAMASVGFTLDIGDFSLQDPNAANDWAPPGGTLTVNLAAQSLYNYSGTLSVTCSLDIGGTCSGGSLYIQGTSPTPINLSISVPSGTSPGTHTLTVTASDGTLTHATAFPFYIADYSGKLSNTSLTLATGASGTVIATVSATSGFAGTVSFACSGTALVTCSFSPATVLPTGTSSQTTNITVTAGASAQVFPIRHAKWDGFWLAVLVFPFGTICTLGRRGRTRSARFSLLLFLMLPILAFLSCGGSNGGNGGGGSNSYAVTVNASVANTNTTRTLGTINVTVTH